MDKSGNLHYNECNTKTFNTGANEHEDEENTYFGH